MVLLLYGSENEIVKVVVSMIPILMCCDEKSKIMMMMLLWLLFEQIAGKFLCIHDVHQVFIIFGFWSEILGERKFFVFVMIIAAFSDSDPLWPATVQ